MNNLTNPPRNAIGDLAGPEWLQISADAYLDNRHRNWILSEEMGDVRFVSEADVVLVHWVRAEHVAQTLAAVAMPAEVIALRPLISERIRQLAPLATPPVCAAQLLAVETKPANRWRDIWGWLGIVAGAAVFVAALAVPLDDAALVVAFALALRGGRVVLDVDS